MSVVSPSSPCSVQVKINLRMMELMFMVNVAKLIDDEEFSLCSFCAEVYP